jgi:Flp pilus assembly protein TadG
MRQAATFFPDPLNVVSAGWRRLGRRGGISLLFALTALPLVGVGALVVDVAMAYSQQQSLQQVADAAALAGALAYTKTTSTAAVQQTVQDVVVANGWPKYIIQTPASEYLATDPYTAGNQAVQVSLSKTLTTWFGAYISSIASFKTSVTSLATIKTTQGACMLSLSTLEVGGTLTANNCDVVANTDVTIDSGHSITTGTLGYGGTLTNKGTINATQKSGVTVSDPFASLQAAAAAGFTNCAGSVTKTSTIAPGCYSGVDLESSQTLTLQAGTYYFTTFAIPSNSTLIATAGTTVIIQKDSSPNGTIDITAPTSGQWAGLALYDIGKLSIDNTEDYEINGAIYDPNNQLTLNTTSVDQNMCLNIVAQSIWVQGGVTFTVPQTNCSSVAYAGKGASSVKLAH